MASTGTPPHPRAEARHRDALPSLPGVTILPKKKKGKKYKCIYFIQEEVDNLRWTISIFHSILSVLVTGHYQEDVGRSLNENLLTIEREFTTVKQFMVFLPRDREVGAFWVQFPMEITFSSELVSQRTCIDTYGFMQFSLSPHRLGLNLILCMRKWKPCYVENLSKIIETVEDRENMRL